MAGLFDMQGRQDEYKQKMLGREAQALSRRPQQAMQEGLSNPYDLGTLEYITRKRKMMQMEEEARLAQEQAEIEARYSAQAETTPGFFSGLFGS